MQQKMSKILRDVRQVMEHVREKGTNNFGGSQKPIKSGRKKLRKMFNMFRQFLGILREIPKLLRTDCRQEEDALEWRHTGPWRGDVF